MDSDKKAKEQRLEEMRERADALNVHYHHRANADTIEAAINKRLLEIEGGDMYPKEKRMEDRVNSVTLVGPPEYEEPMTEAEYAKVRSSEEFRIAGALVRCRAQNTNPAKKDWRGEFISVGSARLGTYKKFIPFGSGEPYHVPHIIFKELKDKKCSHFFNEKDDKGRVVRRSKLMPEYVVEELPQLTVSELKDLAQQQALAQGKEA